jgi:serine/threonine protein kinase
MTDERWRQIERLFIQAVECPESERQSFVDRECRGDDDLRRELESLLTFDNPDRRVMTIPALSDITCSDDDGSDMAGRRVGAYRLVRLIGHGGMGSVYLGVRDDDQYEKQVAIKLLKRGMDTDFMLGRFRQERQILAYLEHPFIARLLDGGATGDGLPYFVMECVDGVSITKYCDERNLPVRERLGLFRLVCEAVQHAHQNLVVHRDIKPSNILVTKEGVPKLLDFGIAKLINPALSTGATLTRLEHRMLTPDYASPEQVKGLPISIAGDIYSLGAVLYELLTGERPHRFISSSPGDIQRAICEVDPPKPSLAAAQNSKLSSSARKLLRRQLSGDLDNIVLTAMRKEPQRRYSSAAELSDDIRRHMQALPIVAQEDRWIYRAGKFIRRHRLGVLAAVLVLATLITGIVMTTLQARRAERRFQIVRGLANSVLSELHDEVQRLPGSTKARAAMVETVLRYLDNLARDAGQDPGLRLEIAKAYRRIGAIEGHPFHANLGRTAASRTHYQRALAILQTLESEAETHTAAVEEMIRVNIEIGDIELAAGNLESAKASFKAAAVPIQSAQLSANTEVYVYFRLGDIEAQQGAPEAALPHFRKALERARAWADSSNEAAAWRDVQGAYRRVANAARESGDLAACRDNLRKAKQVIEEQLKWGDPNVEDQRNLWTTYVVLADVLGGPDELNFGDTSGALVHYRAGVELAEKLVAADRHDVRVRRDLGVSYRRFGRFLFDSAPREALNYYAKSLEIAENLHAVDPANIDFRRDVAESNLGLGMLAMRSGRNNEALQRLSSALDLQRSIEAAAPYRVWLVRYITQIHTEIGNVLMLNSDADGALRSYQEALAAAERLLARAPASLHLERDRADVLEATGRYFLRISTAPSITTSERAQRKAEARSYFQRSLSTWRRWAAQNLGAPYTGLRLSNASAALASASQP